jgi:hypothetical protein
LPGLDVDSESCGFFMWAEDNPVLVAAEVEAEKAGGDFKTRQLQLWRARWAVLEAPHSPVITSLY